MSIEDNYPSRTDSSYELEITDYSFVVTSNGEYEIEVTVYYNASTNCKFFANLYPDVEDRDLHAKGAHFDTARSFGVPITGKNKFKFSLRVEIPPAGSIQKKTPKKIAMGLIDYKNWNDLFIGKEYDLIVDTTDMSSIKITIDGYENQDKLNQPQKSTEVTSDLDWKLILWFCVGLAIVFLIAWLKK